MASSLFFFTRKILWIFSIFSVYFCQYWIQKIRTYLSRKHIWSSLWKLSTVSQQMITYNLELLKTSLCIYQLKKVLQEPGIIIYIWFKAKQESLVTLQPQQKNCQFHYLQKVSYPKMFKRAMIWIKRCWQTIFDKTRFLDFSGKSSGPFL